MNKSFDSIIWNCTTMVLLTDIGGLNGCMCHFVGSRFNYIPLEMPLVTVYLLISKNSHGSF